MNQQKLMIESVRRVMSLDPEQYKENLKSMLEAVEVDARRYKLRVAVRKKRLVPRFLSVIVLLIRGEYRNSSGLKAILRDLL